MNLRDYLAESGESATAFAKRAGLAVSTITRLNNGDRPAGVKSINAIYKATDGKVTANDLYGWTPEPAE